MLHTQPLPGACAELGTQYRHTKLRTPQTNGLVAALQRPYRLRSAGHHHLPIRQLEQLLRGFNAAYNARRQRVLEGRTAKQWFAERLTAKPALAKDRPTGRAGPCDLTKARLIAENAKEVSQPDN